MERLPVELADLVVTHLSLSDYQALRLVSRQIHALTLSHFISRYFSRRTTTLGPPSLRRLSLVSSVDRLASSVSLLEIVLLNHDDYQNLHKISRVGIYPPPKRFQQVAQVRTQDISEESAFFDKMQTNNHPKSVVRTLANALRQFPQLRAVRLRINGTMFPSDVFDDRLEGARDRYALFAKACFKATIGAIVGSGIELQEFSLIKGSRLNVSTKSANLIYPAFNFSIPELLTLSKSFRSLRILRLSIRCDYHENAREPGWQNGISQFVAAAPSLEELTLYFYPWDSEPAYRAAAMHSLLTTVELSMLRALYMYACVVDQQVLSNFVQAHTMLRQISLTDVHLLNGPWTAILASFRDSLDLERLHLSNLHQSGPPRDIVLRDGKRRKLKLNATDKAEQRSMHQMITEVIDRLALPSTHPDGHVPVASPVV